MATSISSIGKSEFRMEDNKSKSKVRNIFRKGWWNLNAKSEGNKSGKIKNKTAPLN
ncbi:hypothetical protein PV326_008105, partial [Microctonus aethiopoides]